jgi:6-phospho-beta-glucosidase
VEVFTNPPGIITQAITTHRSARAVGVCDTPSETIARMGDFVGADAERITCAYSGLNHLGPISSVVVDDREQIDELAARYDELRAVDHFLRCVRSRTGQNDRRDPTD